MTLNWQWIPVLILLGVTLIGLEIFVPGMVLASAGALCLIGSVVVAYVTLGALGGTVLLAVEVVGLIIGVTQWMKWFPTTRLGRKIVLQTTTGVAAQVEDKESLLHAEGNIVATCRPSGIAEFAKRRYDVISEAAFVPVGQKVKVVSIEGNKIIVRAV